MLRAMLRNSQLSKCLTSSWESSDWGSNQGIKSGEKKGPQSSRDQLQLLHGGVWARGSYPWSEACSWRREHRHSKDVVLLGRNGNEPEPSASGAHPTVKGPRRAVLLSSLFPKPGERLSPANGTWQVELDHRLE
ncbi:rCG60850 [Rattus norvegicus]|uniref:RCG60850 n=1 Tax=Rattus norvegicus TaxID=10116 RepID=A6JJL7_RAT|nr:rCG60850 [Rattus norvegicus]